MNPDRLKATLVVDEGLRLKPYWDSVSKLTIGVGRNLDDRGITKTEAMYLLNRDITQATRDAKRAVENFLELSDVRQEIIVNMVFNMGLTRFKGFRNTIKAIEAKDYELASIEMLDSLWARQVGPRAKRLARRMRTGKHT